MQTIGLIGGITPQSTILYYQILNSLASKQYGDKHSCKIVIHGLDFGEISNLQHQDDWDALNVIMQNAGKSLEKAGAKVIIIGANTMHLCVEAMRKVVNIPIIHIAEVTAKEIKKKSLTKVGLLGTKFTMELPFYKDILTSFGIETIIPDASEREIVNSVIYEELSKGIFTEKSKQTYLKIIENLRQNGAEGVILGCTEIPLLVSQKDTELPLFDTTQIHAESVFKIATYE